MKRILFLFWVFVSCILNGQQYGGRRPIEIRLILSPPYSTYLPDYVSPSNNTLNYKFRNTDNTAVSYQLFFKFSLYRNQTELVIQNNPQFLSTATLLNPGMNFIYGYDLEQYFLPQHLEF